MDVVQRIHSVLMHLRGDIASCAKNKPRLEFMAASTLVYDAF